MDAPASASRRPSFGWALIPACLVVTVAAHAAGHVTPHLHSLLIAPPLAGLELEAPFAPAPALGLGLIAAGAVALQVWRWRTARRARARA